MNITVLGATGRTGEHVVQQALKAKHQVTAVVRNPAKLQLHHPALTIAQADVLDPTTLTEHLTGRDAIISALGAGHLKPSTICTDSAESILRAMPKARVRRLIVVSTSGATTEGDRPFTRYLLKPVLGRVFRHPWGDMRRMEELIMASDTDWTIVRPPRLTNTQHTGIYRTATNRSIPGGNSIPRANLANALLNTVTNRTTYNQTLTVAT
ncbi:NAD(P)-dependent oxidoreductase [Crossiella cryophila]|uniref:Putative NADH-flavin reductase n=1 Tax=Crossiella cryophila TaxID=43355 RepID=A0A7W7CJT3_9PSEU|nr:NAD(P)-binding oxidoreductase [Crossiella cryophila]MBB4682481.1 putative NADH-flavin reductase [Crossiella cryophila]